MGSWRSAGSGLVGLALAQSACAGGPSGTADDGGLDGGGEGGAAVDGAVDDGGGDGATDGGDGEADPLPPPWDGLSFRPLREGGDGLSDCTAEDPTCFEADIVQLSYAVDGGDLCFDLRFAGPFLELEREIGSFEVFAFPEDPALAGHSFRSTGGSMTYWDAECATARKHDGCHWYAERDLEAFEMEWVGAGRLLARVSLAEWGFEGLETVLLGVGAAPFLITRTAELTDRYPDELWITASAVTGLEAASLEP